METCAYDESRPWFYGMTLLGDPTLKLSRFLPDQTGELNQDGVINLGDLVFLISYLYRGGVAPDPLRLGDVTADCLVNLADVVFLITYLYKSGPPPGIGCA
jgi:hypothetical protein